jgi:exonuclease SbcD
MAQTLTNPKFDPHLPSVLVAHLHVRGANVNNALFRISDAEDVLIDAAVLQTGWAYAALGHIHLPQAVGDVETVRYPGPLDRLDFGEKTDTRGVLLFDLGPTGLAGAPQRFPLEPTPFHDISIADPDAELPGLAEKYPDHDTAIVRITIEKDGEKVSRDEIGRKLRTLFPRLHQLWLPETTSAGEVTSSVSGADKPFAERIRAYLADSLANDPDRDAVIALAETFLDAEAKEAAP